MRSHASRVVLAATCLVFLGAAASCVATFQREETGSSPAFTGDALPRPPAQGKPLVPHATALAPVTVSAVKTLFEQGLADPRGCEYREIEVGTGSCWSGDNDIVKTHGWVLPDGAAKGRFAVCWNGLVYPAVSVGAAADLKADCLAAIEADEETRAEYKMSRPEDTFRRFRNATAEGKSVSHKTLQPLAVCLLLRLGQVELAEKVWQTWTAGTRPDMNDAASTEDPYFMLATDWTWALFDRAVCAQMRGDDRLALLSARALAPISRSVSETARARGFDVEELSFLDPLGALLADQERRAREKKPEPPGEKESKAARIPKEIRLLENVGARQMGQPGGVDLGWDCRVRALIAEGDDAVEPLLECLVNDNRLTRSVHFHRDFFRHRSLIGVPEAAYVALAGILKTSFFGVTSTGDDLSSRGPEGRAKVAAQIRAYWKQFKDVPPAERWFRTLADDAGPPSQWFQAAENIVRPENVQVQPGSMFLTGGIIVPPSKPGETPKMQGESLRGKKSPSVADLMDRRIHDTVRRAVPDPDSKERFTDRNVIGLMRGAKDVALALAAWDKDAARPALRFLFDELRRAQGRDTVIETRSDFAWLVAELTVVLADAGDTQALADYAAWLGPQSPKVFETQVAPVLKPLWCFPEHPAIAEVADKLFNGAGSPWNPLFQPENKATGFYTERIMETPLLAAPAFRRHLQRHLADKEVIGHIKVRPNGDIDIEVENGWRHSTMTYPNDPLGPKPGAQVDFRLCDLYANLLCRFLGAPQCELYWPQAERDAAVAASAAFFRRYADRYVPSAAARRSWYISNPQFTLEPLGRPAAKEDVERGRAIFSLEGQGEVRLWKLPSVPAKARWVALKQFPYLQFDFDEETGKSTPKMGYLQDGQVWQAEEVLRNGKWERYYGFVGFYIVAKVPAEEIQFIEYYHPTVTVDEQGR